MCCYCSDRRCTFRWFARPALLLQTRWQCGHVLGADLLAVVVVGWGLLVVAVLGWLALLFFVPDVYRSRVPSRMIRSVVCTKLSLYALLLYLPVLKVKARVERVDFASFRASGWVGSARILERVLTHAASMNVSRLLML